jgi:hypothetical protein
MTVRMRLCRRCWRGPTPAAAAHVCRRQHTPLPAAMLAEARVAHAPDTAATGRQRAAAAGASTQQQRQCGGPRCRSSRTSGRRTTAARADPPARAGRRLWNGLDRPRHRRTRPRRAAARGARRAQQRGGPVPRGDRGRARARRRRHRRRHPPAAGAARGRPLQRLASREPCAITRMRWSCVPPRPRRCCGQSPTPRAVPVTHCQMLPPSPSAPQTATLRLRAPQASRCRSFAETLSIMAGASGIDVFLYSERRHPQAHSSAPPPTPTHMLPAIAGKILPDSLYPTGRAASWVASHPARLLSRAHEPLSAGTATLPGLSCGARVWLLPVGDAFLGGGGSSQPRAALTWRACPARPGRRYRSRPQTRRAPQRRLWCRSTSPRQTGSATWGGNART